jgi:hypothetical protein
VPSSNSASIPDELDHIAHWATTNNLKLNTNKSHELIVCSRRKDKDRENTVPPAISSVVRVESLNILGVTIQKNLSMCDHVNAIVSAGAQSLYALKVLKAHGMPAKPLSDVCRATLVAKLVYASPAWHGFLTSNERARLQAVISKATRWGVYDSNASSIEDIINKADATLFQQVLSNESHVLRHLIPPVKSSSYNLRTRAHNRVLPEKTSAASRNFFTRMLYKNIF